MSLIARLMVMLGVIMVAVPAEAACTLPGSTTTTFAAASSYDLRAGSIGTVAAPPSLSCNGALIVLASTNSARATATSLNGFRLKTAAGDTIGYRLSADAAGSLPFAQGGTIEYFSASLLSALGILNGNSFVPTMFAAVTEAPNITAGTYTDVVTVNWAWRVCHGLGVGGVCVLEETGSGTTTMTVTLTIAGDCRISAPALSFGSAPLATQFASVTQAVAVDCTKGAAYTVAFTSGLSGASRPWRAMTSSAGKLLQYNLYRADGATIWDTANPAPGGVGTGSTTPSQMQVYVARINPNQITPPPGQYSDTLSVIVAF